MNFCSKIVQIQLSFFSTCMDNFFLMMPYNSVSQNFCTMQRVGFVSEFQRKDGNPHTSFTSTKRWQSKHANTSFFSHNFEAKIKIADAFFSLQFLRKDDDSIVQEVVSFWQNGCYKMSQTTSHKMLEVNLNLLLPQKKRTFWSSSGKHRINRPQTHKRFLEQTV